MINTEDKPDEYQAQNVNALELIKTNKASERIFFQHCSKNFSTQLKRISKICHQMFDRRKDFKNWINVIKVLIYNNKLETLERALLSQITKQFIRSTY